MGEIEMKAAFEAAWIKRPWETESRTDKDRAWFWWQAAVSAAPHPSGEPARDQFERWAETQHLAIEPEQFEDRNNDNDHYYQGAYDNAAFVGWKAAIARCQSGEPARAEAEPVAWQWLSSEGWIDVAPWTLDRAKELKESGYKIRPAPSRQTGPTLEEIAMILRSYRIGNATLGDASDAILALFRPESAGGGK